MKLSKPLNAEGHCGSPPNLQLGATGDGFGNSNPHHPAGQNRSGRRFGNPNIGPGNRSRGYGYRERPADRNNSKPTAGLSHSDGPRIPSPQERELTAKFTKLLEAKLAADGGCYTDDDEVSVTASKANTPLATPSKQEMMLEDFKNRYGVSTSQSLEPNSGCYQHALNISANSPAGLENNSVAPLDGKSSNEKAHEKHPHSHPKRYAKKNDKKKPHQHRSHQVSTSSSGHNGGMSSSPTASPEVPRRWRTNSRQKSISEVKHVSPAPALPVPHAKLPTGGETPADPQTSAQLTQAAFLREGGPPSGETPDVLKMVASVLQNETMRKILKQRDPQLYDQMIKYVMDTAAQTLKI